MKKYPDIRFTPSLIDRVGPISRVLGQFLDRQTEEVQASLKKEYPDVPEDAVRRLLSTFATIEGTKKPLPPDQIQVLDLSTEAIRYCLVELENARILRFDEYAYELSHDTLALRIAEQRSAAEVALLEVTKLVKDRLEAYSTTGTYLNNKELQLIENYTEALRSHQKLSPEEWVYIEKSSSELQKRKRNRIALIAVIITTLALLAAFGITQALIAQKQTKVAEDRRQEAETQKQRAVDAAERADSARIVADNAFQVARQREVEANTERQKAEANAQEARKNLLLANKNEEEANKQRDKAQENARKLEKEKATVEARELELKDRNERILSLNDSINQAFLEVAQQQAIAQGNFLKSEALLTLQSGDPSKAFRVAEYAWKKEKERPVIYPPFLNIYYSGKSFYYLKSFCTNPFYQIDYQGNQNIARAIFSPDDQQSLILFQEAQHALLRSSTADIHLEHESNVSSLCFSNSGKYIATGDEEGAIHIWRKDGRKTETLKRHQGEITDLAFLNEEQYLISTGDDQRILLWDLEDAQTKPSMLKLPRMRRGFQQLAVSPKGDYIAAITDKDLFLFKRRTKLLYQLKKVKLFKVNQVFQDIQFTPDGKELYLFTREAIRYIDIDNLKEKDIFTFSADISSAELDPSGNFLLLTFIRSKVMELFDLTKKESIARLQGHNGWVRSAVFSGDGTLALSSSDDNTVRIWQLNGKKIPHFVGKEQLPYRQGTSEYSFSYQNDSISIRKKGVAEAYWKVKRKLTSDSKVIVSPNGEAMIILSRNSSIASLWRRTGGSEILRGHSGNLTAASFTSTGALLATASDKGEVILWDSAANRLHQLSPGNRVENLWFSSDKKHLIVEFPQEQFIAYLISAEGLMEKARELQIPELDQSTLGRLNIE